MSSASYMGVGEVRGSPAFRVAFYVSQFLKTVRVGDPNARSYLILIQKEIPRIERLLNETNCEEEDEVVDPVVIKELADIFGFSLR